MSQKPTSDNPDNPDQENRQEGLPPVPEKVRQAARRLSVQSVVRQPPLPKTFRRIVEHDRKYSELINKLFEDPMNVTITDWTTLNEMREDRKELTRKAEVALSRVPPVFGGSA